METMDRELSLKQIVKLPSEIDGLRIGKKKYFIFQHRAMKVHCPKKCEGH